MNKTVTKEGPTMKEVYKGAMVKGGATGRKVVKTLKAEVNTDFKEKKTSAVGTQTKRVYKDNVLVKTKTKKLGRNKIFGL